MFGKRSGYSSESNSVGTDKGNKLSQIKLKEAKVKKSDADSTIISGSANVSDYFKMIKKDLFSSLVETLDMGQVAKLDRLAARDEINDVLTELISIKNLAITMRQQEQILREICDELLGLGPLEPLLKIDGIADIMVNGSGQTYIERGGKVELTDVLFEDEEQLLNICQRIVSKLGRRVDESSPICDARLPDGSRVNVITKPLAIDGTSLTIRRFTKEKLQVSKMVEFGSVSPNGAELLRIIGKCKANVLVSGGTGSGKTTLLNALTGFISNNERIVTCEDSAELQLQQPHVVRLETRPPNIEGEGQVTMADLVKNCLRMRPDRIVVGEVRSHECFDLLQAMNTGHDGSMGTLHANSPREAISRAESMIMMGGFGLPAVTIRRMLCAAVDIIVQCSRLRDGSRRIMNITEVLDVEGEEVNMQDLYRYVIDGEDDNKKLIGHHEFMGVKEPLLMERASYMSEGDNLSIIMASKG